MKRVILMAVVAVALGSCAARKGWEAPADLLSGDAPTIVGQAAQAGALGELLQRAEAEVFDVDEERMAELLRAALATGKLSDSQQATARWMLHDVCEVNPVGAVGPDFRFATPQISENSLLTYHAGQELLVVFYNPDCEHCRQTIARLSEIPGLPEVMAVCIEAPEKRWQETRRQLPAAWTPAYDRSGIMENDIYMIRRLPSIYLFDGDRRIEMKNPAVETVKQRYAKE